MSNLRRYYKENQIYFITCVTINRMQILTKYYGLLNRAIKRKMIARDAKIYAWCVMPDHLHIIIDPKQNNLSSLMKSFKLSFSENLRKSNPQYIGRIWQYRFWDHIIRNQEDLNNHINYIHFNPVKHNHVTNPKLWKYSSFNEYRKDGYYGDDWGVSENMMFAGEYGE